MEQLEFCAVRQRLYSRKISMFLLGFKALSGLAALGNLTGGCNVPRHSIGIQITERYVIGYWQSTGLNPCCQNTSINHFLVHHDFLRLRRYWLNFFSGMRFQRLFTICMFSERTVFVTVNPFLFMS